jgi:hypothetical protein
MDAQQLREDVRAGRGGADRLVDLIVMLQEQLQNTQRELLAAQRRIAEWERQLAPLLTARLDQPYSRRAEEQRQQGRGKKPRRRNKPARKGRITTAQKAAQAERTEAVFPQDVPEHACRRSHMRPVWRREYGRAVLVAYEVSRGPGNRYGAIPGVLGRSPFVATSKGGIEIVVAIAYQVHVVGLSFDKVCLLMNFFQNLKLRKSQADALLPQLARQWESEFETLCTLLAHAAVVHADETSGSLKSVWAFLSEQVRVLFFGVRPARIEADARRNIRLLEGWNETFCLGERRDDRTVSRRRSMDNQLRRPRGRPTQPRQMNRLVVQGGGRSPQTHRSQNGPTSACWLTAHPLDDLLVDGPFLVAGAGSTGSPGAAIARVSQKFQPRPPIPIRVLKLPSVRSAASGTSFGVP